MTTILFLSLATVAAICLALRACDDHQKSSQEKLLLRRRGKYLPQCEVDEVLR